MASSSPPKALVNYISAALTESFAAAGVRLNPVPVVDDELAGDRVAAIMGIVIDDEPGTFILSLASVDLDLLGSALKTRSDLKNDWLGETTNQCVGRLKLALLRNGIIARITPPSVTEATQQVVERGNDFQIVVKLQLKFQGDNRLTCIFGSDADVLRTISELPPDADLPKPGDVVDEAPDVPAAGGADDARRKVLIVEDSATMRQQLAEALLPLGVQIIEAEHGDDGLAKLAQHPDVALVISDVNMPWKSGLEMLAEMRETPAGRHVPVIMLTTEGNPAEIKKAKALGTKAWLLKPIDPAALAVVVAKLFGGRAAA